MPLDGNLFLGINELVVDDNSGILTVIFEVQPDSGRGGPGSGD
jgi:hypothetical protein